MTGGDITPREIHELELSLKSIKTIENDDNRRLADLKKRQKRNRWLMKVASERMGLDYRTLCRFDKALVGRKSTDVVNRMINAGAEFSPEERYAIAHRIRCANAKFEDGIASALGAAAGIAMTNAIRIYTATSEDLFPDDAGEKAWLAMTNNDLKSWRPREEFTGDIDVIIDMEADALDHIPASSHGMNNHAMGSTGSMGSDGIDPYANCVFEPSDVKRMLEFLMDSGACHVFNEVDGYTARYKWEGDHWSSYPYPMIMTAYERTIQGNDSGSHPE